VVQCVVVWCSMVRCVAECCSEAQYGAVRPVWCSAVQCGSGWCSVVQCGAVWCSVGQGGAVWGSAVQFSAVRCSIFDLI